MRSALALVLLLGAAGLAGCASDPAPAPSTYGLELDTIVSGKIAISNTTDYSLVWVHNLGSQRADVRWGLTGPNGSALPAGWTASFGRVNSSLEAKGSSASTGQGIVYTDWDWTLLTINVPRNTSSGVRTLELWANATVKKPIEVTVRSLQYPVAKIGAKIKTNIEGRFEDTGEVFQPRTDFDMEVGSSGTIPGFSAGHIGLAKLEEVRLRLPPPLGYGYEGHQLAGRTLMFQVKIVAGV